MTWPAGRICGRRLRPRYPGASPDPGASFVLSGLLTSVTEVGLWMQPLGEGNADAVGSGSVANGGTGGGGKVTTEAGWTVMVIVAGSLAWSLLS
jgi:hypothetical protein